MRVFIDLACRCKEHTPSVRPAHLSKNHGSCHPSVRLLGMAVRVTLGDSSPRKEGSGPGEHGRLALMPHWVFALLLVTPLEALFA